MATVVDVKEEADFVFKHNGRLYDERTYKLRSDEKETVDEFTAVVAPGASSEAEIAFPRAATAPTSPLRLLKGLGAGLAPGKGKEKEEKTLEKEKAKKEKQKKKEKGGGGGGGSVLSTMFHFKKGKKNKYQQTPEQLAGSYTHYNESMGQSEAAQKTQGKHGKPRKITSNPESRPENQSTGLWSSLQNRLFPTAGPETLPGSSFMEKFAAMQASGGIREHEPGDSPP